MAAIQCDRMAKLFFNTRPFTTLKIGTITIFCQSWLKIFQILNKLLKKLAVVVGQLRERSHPTPEVRGSNQVIGKIYIEQCLLSTVLKKNC